MKILSDKDQHMEHLNLGALAVSDQVNFRVWAPKRKKVDVLIEGINQVFPLNKDKDGYFSANVEELKCGSLYRYRLDGDQSFPDPCSRYQPQGPHGPSMIVDAGFPWTDEEWPGIELKGQVIYEVHVGTFSDAGTYAGLMKELPELKRLGITCLEIMPLAEFPGKWNWGYDGVNLFAPAHVYGEPNDLKKLINTAHALGLGVILDVVYNHLGPDGNYLKCYSDDYFTAEHTTDWGEAINFSYQNSRHVREFFLQNACYWISEYHFDGLRLDATQNIYDKSPTHILADISRRTRACARQKKIIIVAENESQEVTLIKPLEQGGYGLDALWNDDFHHSAMVALTGKREAYYTDYKGTPQEFISSLKRGFLYQGQFYKWQNQNRGTYLDRQWPAERLMFFLQNHDQVANSLSGKRISALAHPGQLRALTAFVLLAPQTPLIFMGEEFASSSPFLFFVDHNDELNPKVEEGRKIFLKQFPGCASVLNDTPSPCDPKTFHASKLKFSERQTHQETYRLYEDLLRIRREDPAISAQDSQTIEGAVLGPSSFVLRYFSKNDGDRLLIVNLGEDFDFSPCSEPLLAPSTGPKWKLIWTSDDPKYGGGGIVSAMTDQGWLIQGASAQFYSGQSSL